MPSFLHRSHCLSFLFLWPLLHPRRASPLWLQDTASPPASLQKPEFVGSPCLLTPAWPRSSLPRCHLQPRFQCWQTRSRLWACSLQESKGCRTRHWGWGGKGERRALVCKTPSPKIVGYLGGGEPEQYLLVVGEWGGRGAAVSRLGHWHCHGQVWEFPWLSHLQLVQGEIN